MAVKNFEFLSSKWPILSNLAEAAEKNLQHDPNTTLFKLRLFGEKLTKFLYAFENLKEPNDGRQDIRLRDLKRQDVISKEIFDILDSVRRTGNKATHDAYDSKSEAARLLSLTFQLSVWFMQTYGDWSFEPQPYEEPVTVAVTDELIKQLDELTSSYEDRLLQLQQELDDLRAIKVSNEELAARRTQSKKAASTLRLSEADTRKLIDEQLRKFGWVIDSENLRFSKGTRPVKGKNMAIAEWPLQKDYSADYALFVGLKMVGFIEAKRKGKDVYSDLEQAKKYARHVMKKADEEFLGQWGDYTVPFVFATNGRQYLKQYKLKSGIWFQDLRNPSNREKALQSWYSPEGLMELYAQDIDSAIEKLKNDSMSPLKDYLKLRDYQINAVEKVEEAIADGHDNILVAMATGTGKTRTSIGLIYRLINSKRFKRILFLVDRRALGEQAAASFKESRLTNTQTFTNIFELQELDDKKPNRESKVHITTIQSIIKRIDEADSELSIDTYDCILVDEAHRGYTLDKEMSVSEYEFRDQSEYVSKYTNALEYFDAVKIALTATPALHTKQIFGEPIFTYSYREAVIDGNLVDFEPPHQLTTKLKQNGIKWEKGSSVDLFNPLTGEKENIDELPDEVAIEIEQFNKLVLTENFNKTVLEEIVQYIDPTSSQKTLIFAATDDHADLIVDILKEEYGNIYGNLDDRAIMKITGSIHDPLGEIRLFKNDRLPNIVVTVDLLTTGIDVPEICNLVFMRRVKSRILYEQMIGRATRLCPSIGKEYFHIFDAVGLFEALEPVSKMKPVVVNPTITFQQLVYELNETADETRQKEIIEQIAAKLQRKKQRMDEEGKADFSTLSGEKSIEDFVSWLKKAPVKQVNEALQTKQNLVTFLDENKARPKLQFISEHEDELVKHERGYGNATRPEDYLDEFGRFIRENMNLIPALEIVCTRPKELTKQVLKELQLELDKHGYTEANLRTAWQKTTMQDIAASIIGFIRQRALNDALISHEERVKRAMQKVYAMQDWTPMQRNWLTRIEKKLVAEKVLDPDAQKAFDVEPFRSDINGFKGLNNIFKGSLQHVLDQINESLYTPERKNA